MWYPYRGEKEVEVYRFSPFRENMWYPYRGEKEVEVYRFSPFREMTRRVNSAF